MVSTIYNSAFTKPGKPFRWSNKDRLTLKEYHARSVMLGKTNLLKILQGHDAAP